jgi:hypothetical protein
MRICVFGVSHRLALEEGWMSLRADGIDIGAQIAFAPAGYRPLTLDEAGVPVRDYAFADGIAHLKPYTKGRRRYVEDRGLKDGVVLRDFDAFVMVGAIWSGVATRLYAHCRAESHSPHGASQCVSDECFQDAIAAKLRASANWQFVSDLREATTAPIAVIAAPQVVERGYVRSDDRRKMLERLRTNRDEERLHASWRAAVLGLAGPGIDLIDQAAETLVSPFVSRDIFSVPDSLNMQGEVVNDDGHLNDAYGRIMLRECVAWANAALARRGAMAAVA